MRVMSSNRLTIILDDKTEVTGFETEHNEESMEHAQASGSIFCGCARGPRYRRCLRRMRVCEEEFSVCSSLSLSLSVESEFDTGIKSGSTKNMMIDLVKMLCNVFLMQATVPPKVSQRGVELDKFDICYESCFDHKNV